MKFGNYLIVTLPDFARYFTLQDFWENRKQFVRDMHPDKVYYWNKALEQAYFDVVAWIANEGPVSDSVKSTGIKALEKLTGREIDKNQFLEFETSLDFVSPVICVQAGQSVDLPEYKSGTKRTINLRWSKIEVHGKSVLPSVIRIGKRSVTLHTGEFVYATALDNQFIEFMPIHLQNTKCDMSLVSQDGESESDMIVRDLLSGWERTYKGVKTFAVVEDGYIYVDAKGQLMIMGNMDILNYKSFLRHSSDIHYVKACGKEVIVLYRDGTLKSTMSSVDIHNVISAEISQGKTEPSVILA